MFFLQVRVKQFDLRDFSTSFIGILVHSKKRLNKRLCKTDINTKTLTLFILQWKS